MSKHFTLPYEGGLIEQNLPAGILHTYEKIWTHVYPESRPASYAIADLIDSEFLRPSVEPHPHSTNFFA